MYTTIRVSHIVRDKAKVLAAREGLTQGEYIARLIEKEHRLLERKRARALERR